MRRGEVWLFDCGLAEKVRPVLILSIAFADTDRAVVTVVFHSTALRGSQFEVKVHVPFLKEGAFIAQSIATYPTARAIRPLGVLDPAQLSCDAHGGARRAEASADFQAFPEIPGQTYFCLAAWAIAAWRSCSRASPGRFFALALAT